MKRLLLKILLFFGLFIIPFLALFLTPYPKDFAYHFIKNDCYNHGAWIYDRITKNTVPIDIAFIGSSHTIHAYQEKKMEDRLGPDYHLANLGYCRYGRDLEYLTLKLLLRNKSPKMIVLEVHEDEEKNSHDIFPFLAETKDIIFTPTLINRDYLADLIHGASARLEYFKTTYVFTEKIPITDFSLYGYGESMRTVSEKELTDNEMAWGKRLGRKTFESVEEVQLKYPMAYLKKMVELIKEKNRSIVFVYLPEFGSKLKVPKYAGYYQSIAPLLIPPESVLDNPVYWMDASHLNDKGSEILSEWMVKQIQNEFCLNH
ncbi:MAG: hypothetical protein Q8N05_02335 [Bacteroidota bacterium]|nr:hypothetical protein [Bacteroidota bacterium]